MNEYTFIISGSPIPWQRSGSGHYGFKSWRYDSQKVAKDHVRKKLLSQLRRMTPGRSELTSLESLWVTFTFLLGTDDRLTEGKRNAKLWGLETACQKPDLDNLEKFYLDCAKGFLWKDDRSIVRLSSKKVYSENPRTIIRIMSKKELEVPESVTKVLRVMGPEKMRNIAKHVQALTFLSEEAIKENTPEMEEPRRGEWLAWTSLLLTRLARDHFADFAKLAKIEGIEEDVQKIIPL